MNRYRYITWLTLATVMAMLSPAMALAGSITLREYARATGDVVTLADVADLQGDEARQFAALEVAALPAGADAVRVNLSDLRQALTDHGAHMGRLTVSGAMTCQVQRVGPVAAQALPVDGPTRADVQPMAMANPVAPLVAVGMAEQGHAQEATETVEKTGTDTLSRSSVSLRQQLLAWLCESLGVESDDLRVSWPDELPGLIGPADQVAISFEPVSSDLLGRTLVTIRQFDRLREQSASARLSLEVQARRQVVIAQRTLQRGELFEASDVRMETRWLDSQIAQPVGQPEALIGQTVARLVRRGAVIDAGDVEPTRLVDRGDLVTVRCLSGALVLKTTGRAMDHGVSGEVIKLRNQTTRETFTARVTGPREAVLVVDQPANGSGQLSRASAVPANGGGM
jgi:flagella basal body P-ring formation protein FlgA